jgi:hypothetical protein
MTRWLLLLILGSTLGCSFGYYVDCRRASEEICAVSLACQPELAFPEAGTYVCPAGHPEAIPARQCVQALTYGCVSNR